MTAAMDTDLLTDPRSWRMVASVTRRRLTAMLYSTARAGIREMREYALTDDGDDAWLRSLEEAVYDHPILLSDFDRVSVIIDTPVFTIIPSQAVSHAAMLLAASPQGAAEDDPEITISQLGVDNALLVMGLRRDLAGFLRRTFPEMNLWHHLAVPVRFFASRASAGGNGPRLYAIMHEGAADIVALDRNRLLSAMTHRISAPADAAYYIMATLRRLSMDPMTDEVFVGGPTEPRNAVMSILRTYVSHAMPVILPAAAGNDQEIPFVIKTLPLCE